MRFAELALASLPVVLAITWLVGVRYANPRLVLALALVLAGIGLGLICMGQERGFTGAYTPARLQDGRVVPEHGG